MVAWCVTWDPFGTLAQALWITGGQWAGKSTVANLLAVRCGLTAYHYDYHDARGHLDRRTAAGITLIGAEQAYVRNTPQQTAEYVLAGFPRRFEWALDDLRALVSGRPVVAEGWGLRPELVAPLVPSPRQVIVMVPTDEFRLHQAAVVPRAGALSHPVSDPELAQRNRLERDRLVAADAVRKARELGIRVLEVDGSLDAEAVAGVVAEHFGLEWDGGEPREAAGKSWRA
jgi:2-phosphoglycerate kinase